MSADGGWASVDGRRTGGLTPAARRWVCDHGVYEGDGGQDRAAVALKRLLEIANSLPDDAGSDERPYIIHGCGDMRLILLSDQMLDFIETIGGVLDHDWIPGRADQIELGARRTP